MENEFIKETCGICYFNDHGLCDRYGYLIDDDDDRCKNGFELDPRFISEKKTKNKLLN